MRDIFVLYRRRDPLFLVGFVLEFLQYFMNFTMDDCVEWKNFSLK